MRILINETFIEGPLVCYHRYIPHWYNSRDGREQACFAAVGLSYKTHHLFFVRLYSKVEESQVVFAEVADFIWG